MSKQSPRIKFYDKDKLSKINPETIKLWKRYKIDMTLRELSPKTIDGYYNDLQHWWIYIYDNQGNQSVTDLDEGDITEFLFYCKTQGNNSRRMKRRMSSISAFYKFLRKKRLIDDDPTEYIDRPKKDTDILVQTFLTSEQVGLIREKLNEGVEDASTVSQKHLSLQLRCYIFFSLSTMARVSAVSSVKWDQIDFDERIADDVVEKEGYLVTLYFSNEVKGYLIELKNFREENGIDDNGYVFVAQNSGEYGQISTAALNQWCKKVGRSIDVPTLHCHDLRHSGSQLMKLAGATVEDISQLLNHKSTDVTIKHYLRVDKTKIRESRDKYGV